MHRTIYLDTNTFYNAAGNKIAPEIIRSLRRAVESRQVGLSCSPLVLIEVASHLNRRESQDFGTYQRIMQVVRDWCGELMLDYPDAALAQVLGIGGLHMTPKRDLNELKRIRDLICVATDYEELVQGRRTYWDGRLATVRLQEGYVEQFRGEAEAQWISDMTDSVAEFLIPRYRQRIAQGKPPKLTNQKLRQALLDFLDGVAYRRGFCDALYCKASGLPSEAMIGEQPVNEMDAIIDRLSAYFAAYKAIIRLILVDGYAGRD